MTELNEKELKVIKILANKIMNAYNKGDSDFILNNINYTEMYRNTLRNFGKFCQIQSSPPKDYEINFKNQMSKILSIKRNYKHSIESIKLVNNYIEVKLIIENYQNYSAKLILLKENGIFKVISLPHFKI
ncbi:MAG: hypothetical protein GF329_00675 [Candidatus Lokiarchaeota archaeon]|nr:hypothetical protein [Candidatus Lokiarchaeota archaeon]